jgi:hypothetical protein
MTLNIGIFWIEKTTGLGISKFTLRSMAWLCLKDNALSGSQMCIVTGPFELAIGLIDRMKNLFVGKKRRRSCYHIRYKGDSNRIKRCKDRSISFTSFRRNERIQL